MWSWGELDNALGNSNVDTVRIMQKFVFPDYIRIYHSVVIKAGTCQDWEVRCVRAQRRQWPERLAGWPSAFAYRRCLRSSSVREPSSVCFGPPHR